MCPRLSRDAVSAMASAGGNTLIRRVVRGMDPSHVPKHPPSPVQVTPEIRKLLQQPTWSVRSLLPPSTSTRTASASSSEASQKTGEAAALRTETVTRTQLHHLLRLSALPLPKSQAEEDGMLSTLESQLHFVKQIQSVDTEGVRPLVAIRDETAEGIDEQTITLDDLKPFLDVEEKVGRNGTVRRRKNQDDQSEFYESFDMWHLGRSTELRKQMNPSFYVRRQRKQVAKEGEKKEDEKKDDAGDTTKE